MKQTTAGVVIKVDDKYLICRSTSSFDKKGREVWGFPKGRKDKDETIIEAALRETFEETGIHLYEFNIEPLTQYSTKNKYVYFYLTELEEFDVDELECEMSEELGYPEIDKFLLVEKKDLTKYIHNHMLRVVMKLPESIKMCKCGENPETEPHMCPYAQDIDGNDDPEYCTCCSECVNTCCDDI